MSGELTHAIGSTCFQEILAGCNLLHYDLFEPGQRSLKIGTSVAELRFLSTMLLQSSLGSVKFLSMLRRMMIEDCRLCFSVEFVSRLKIVDFL